VSLSDELVQSLLDRVEENQAEMTKLEERIVEIKEVNDVLRDALYGEWSDDEEIFTPSKNESWPPCFKNQSNILTALDGLHEGVGLAHKLVLEYRYPEQKSPPILVEPLQPRESQPLPSQVVVQTQPPPQQEASRVRSVFTGFHERAINRDWINYLREKDDLDRQARSQILTSEVVRDPVEVGNELLAALNETKEFITNCYRIWPRRRNRFFALNVHETLRQRVAKLLTIVESFTYAEMELERKEIRHQIIAQTSNFTRILEAQAMAPATIQQITNPYKESGWRDTDFDQDQMQSPRRKSSRR
jgi:hypothetical protein